MQGAITAVFLVANIAASLVAVLAFIAFINAILVRKGLYRNILFWRHATSPFNTGPASGFSGGHLNPLSLFIFTLDVLAFH